jgi:hypothetical protein
MSSGFEWGGQFLRGVEFNFVEGSGRQSGDIKAVQSTTRRVPPICC